MTRHPPAPAPAPHPLDPPPPPDFTVPWADLDRSFSWIRRLRDVPQDPHHHGEGDVWIHTRLVCDALAAAPAFRALPDDDRRAAWLGALLHDVAKPDCTTTDPDGSIHARGHSARGAILARRILWAEGVPFATRERVCAIVRNHQVPFFLIGRDDRDVLQRRVALTTPARVLATVAEADARGRVAGDQQRLVDNVALFAESCAEAGCLDAPPTFASPHTRLRYFQTGGKVAPDWPQHEAFRCELVLMSGLPGAGKDTWVRANLPDWPVVSLDALREAMDVDPRDEQGAVVQAAREQARAHLRAGRNFVWSATNLSRALRTPLVELGLAYGARVRIVYVEAAGAEVLARQNRERGGRVPGAVVERLMGRWEVPEVTEAHGVEWVGRG
jgi:predicted kinase